MRASEKMEMEMKMTNRLVDALPTGLLSEGIEEGMCKTDGRTDKDKGIREIM